MIKMALVHFQMKIIILLLKSCVREQIKAFGCFCPLFRPVKSEEFSIKKLTHKLKTLHCPNHPVPSPDLNSQLWVKIYQQNKNIEL